MCVTLGVWCPTQHHSPRLRTSPCSALTNRRLWFVVERHAPGRRRYRACWILIADEVVNEAVRKSISKPFSVSRYLSESYTLSDKEYYSSCTKEEKYRKCNRFLLSGWYANLGYFLWSENL